MGRKLCSSALSAANLFKLLYGFSALCYVLSDKVVDRPLVMPKPDDDDSRAQQQLQNSLMDDVQVVIPTERPVLIPPSEVINPKRHVSIDTQHKGNGNDIGNNVNEKQADIVDDSGNGGNAVPNNRHNAHLNHDKEPAGNEAGDNINTDMNFVHGFIASLSVILVSELGDKTFFIAAIMAMRHSRVTIFTGAIGALALMTILSAVFGMAANLIPKIYTYYISTLLFVIFGLKMLRDGIRMSDAEAQEEFEEVQMDLKKREDDFEYRHKLVDAEAATISRSEQNSTLKRLFFCCVPLHIVIQAFTMTFVAEWGDRSQLTTIILGARENVPGVIIGGILGHSLCTGLAVIGGRMIAQRISVKTVTIIGGVVFLIFALSALIFNNPHDEQ